MFSGESYVPTLNRGLRVFFTQFVRASLTRPKLAVFFAATVVRQLLSARMRAKWKKHGLHVPPIVIFSITDRCNLRCKGCFAQAIRTGPGDELSDSDIARIIGESVELGVSFVIIAGGEPLMRPEILDIAGSFPRTMFLLVTNGLLLDAPLVARLRTQPNTIPVLSIEGNEAETDGRRGLGVHERLRRRMCELKTAGVFFSLSLTVNRANFNTVTDSQFIADAIDSGCGFFLFLEYTPVREGTESWVITEDQRKRMGAIVNALRSRYRAVFIAVPWDEEDVGGCLAAGRGFVHISAEGKLEACPLAPFSDRSLASSSFLDALASPLLRLLRDTHEQFDDTSGGCTLWKERERIATLQSSSDRISGDPTD